MIVYQFIILYSIYQALLKFQNYIDINMYITLVFQHKYKIKYTSNKYSIRINRYVNNESEATVIFKSTDALN